MTTLSFRLRNLVMALAVTAGAAGAMAGPALADDWGRRGWDQRERHEQHWRAHPRPVVYARPPAYAYYGAPAYAYAPAPVYAPAPPAFTFVFPLNFQ